MLRIEKVSKDLGDFVLRDVSLEVGNGEYLVIIGPTGSGKTILIETIAGIYASDEGRIFLDGREITREVPRNRKVCMVYQDYMLFPHLSVKENIAFGLKSRKASSGEIEKKVAEASELLGISHLHHRRPETLSGGEQQRVAIARAIVMEPVVMLLDEPLSALDGLTREKLRRELRRIHEVYGTTIIHVTHNFEEVFSLADRVAVMNEGEIVQVGTPEEIFRRPNCEMIANFVGVENIFRGVTSERPGLIEIEVDGLKIVSAATEIGDGDGNDGGDGDGDDGGEDKRGSRVGREVFASVRPEDILISNVPLESSARNSFHGRVEEIADCGMMVKVWVDVGIPFMVMLTRRGYEEMEFAEGDHVYLTFKATAVHIF
ncbi:MAG TPA: ATP-binding cassette domain-containing protein [Methanotrichaceae archaeon]|nr:ATP-binding cassette domain-containing protein [Methanotrichaceae archaeon]